MSKAGASNARPCPPHDITANEVQRMADFYCITSLIILQPMPSSMLLALKDTSYAGD